MTDHEVLDLLIAHRQPQVKITASDYQYDGWLVATIIKRKGALRVVVEDENGRLFIHNAGQLSSH